MGNEFAGEVFEIGGNVTDFKSGDKLVSLTALETCGKYSYCKNDIPILCKNRNSIGMTLTLL